MGHRTLIAYEREDGLYNVHYSHWGGDSRLPLKEEISESTPLGGDGMEPEFLTAFMAALDDGLDDDTEIGGKLAEPQSSTAVEPEPEATGVELSEIVSEMLDFLHHEAFYVVDTDFDVRAFRTWRLHPPEDGEPFEKDVGNGVLVEPSFPDGEPKSLTHFEGMFRGAFGASLSMFETGTLDREDANDWLVKYAKTIVDEAPSDYTIPKFSPRGYPAENCRKGGYATTAIPLVKSVDIPNSTI